MIIYLLVFDLVMKEESIDVTNKAVIKIDKNILQKDQLKEHVYLIYGNFHTLEPIFTHKNHFHLPYNL